MLNGEVDWVYEEELDVRSNYFWSPDSKNIAYLQMNEARCRSIRSPIGFPTHAQVEWQRYPQPGDPNPDVHMGVVPARGGKTVWIRLPFHDGDDYVPRFGWVDRKTIWVETLTPRSQAPRDLYFADADYGQSRQMLEISDDKFVDENYDVDVGEEHRADRAGATGTITSISTATTRRAACGRREAGSATDQRRFRCRRCVQRGRCAQSRGLRVERRQSAGAADLAGRLRRRTQAVERRRGISPSHLFSRWQAFTDKFSTRMSRRRCASARLPGVRASGGQCRVFWETHALDSYHLRAPEQFEVKAHDGTTLYATLLLPQGRGESAGTPLIVNPYGGPHDQTVENKWSGSLLFDELLAAARFCRAPRRQSRHGQPRARLCAGRVSQLRPRAA